MRDLRTRRPRVRWREPGETSAVSDAGQRATTTAAAGNARRAVVIDLDDEIIEVVVPREPVAGLIAVEPDRLVVMTVVRVLAPGVFGPDRAHRQQGLRADMAIGAPP